jgi:hypothetical protein
MARKRVEYLESIDLPMLPALDKGLPLGMLAVTLSEDEQGGAVSFLARMAPQWNRVESGYFQADLELLVVGGDLTVGEQRLDRGGYCFWPAGSWHGPLRTEIGCEVLLMFDATPGFTEAATATPSDREHLRIDGLDTLAMPWVSPPGVDGRSEAEAGDDLHVKLLREDPDTGAYTLYVRQAPGWSEPRVEAHEAWEELILMEGDYLMATNGGVEAGCYIFRNELIPHGPQATRTGSVWLGRGSQAIDFQFSDVDWAQPMIDRYLSADLDDALIERTPWGVWSD